MDRGASADVVIMVQDSGLGLEPTSLDWLLDAPDTTKPDGQGKGLAISRSTVESHGGRLWATDNTPNGAVFRFTLPIRRAA
jgi:signal transduction histidine kinase